MNFENHYVVITPIEEKNGIIEFAIEFLTTTKNKKGYYSLHGPETLQIHLHNQNKTTDINRNCFRYFLDKKDFYNFVKNSENDLKIKELQVGQKTNKSFIDKVMEDPKIKLPIIFINYDELSEQGKLYIFVSYDELFPKKFSDLELQLHNEVTISQGTNKQKHCENNLYSLLNENNKQDAIIKLQKLQKNINNRFNINSPTTVVLQKNNKQINKNNNNIDDID